ncbi:NACHT domain-containing protein [Fusarium sp. LHS14.1]|nr:NACHT domain-containing protein [Fusarium sp. LHS14.1]
MSFGFGVGDFIAVLELVNKVRKDFQSAPSQFQDISNEVKSLSIVLSDVEVTVSETELDEFQRLDLQHLVSSCRDVLETLEETLGKYRDLHPGNGKLRSRGKKVWKRVNWEPDDIREQRERITLNTTLLNTFIGGISSQTIYAIKHGVDRLNIQQDNEQRLKTLDWLTPPDYGTQQQDVIIRRQPGTGKWLLDSKEYQNWLSSSIQHLDWTPDDVKALKKECNKDNSSRRPSLDELLQTLQSVADGFSRVFIVVDALDECQVSDGCRARLLSELLKLQATCRVNIFATSRFVPDVFDTFRGTTMLEIRESNEDVEKYVNGRIEHFPRFVRQTVDGMFLLAKIFLDSLDDKLTPKLIRSGLKDLGKQSQVPGEDGKVLAWITCAKRPLTQSELQHALAVEVGTLQFDQDNLLDMQGTVAACCGLVTVDNESNIIRLVHYITQEYFEQTQAKWFPSAEADIVLACITYLSYDVFGTGYCYGDNELIKRLRSKPLYDYATQHWGHHARKAPAMKEEIIEFLESGRKVEAACQALLCSTRYELGSGTGGGTDPNGGLIGIHLAAYFDLDTVMKSLLESGSMDPNSAASFKWQGDMAPLS